MGRTFNTKRSASTPPTESSSLTHTLHLRLDDRGNGFTFTPEKKKHYLLVDVFGPVMWPTGLLFSLLCRYQGLFSRFQSCCCVKLTVQFHVAPQSGIRRVTIPLPHMSSWYEQEKYVVSISAQYITNAKNVFFVHQQYYK